jgi:hypothetical protein
MPYYFGINVGGGVGPAGIDENGSSSTAKDVEVVINTNANVPDRAQLLLCVEALAVHIAAKTDKSW